MSFHSCIRITEKTPEYFATQIYPTTQHINSTLQFDLVRCCIVISTFNQMNNFPAVLINNDPLTDEFLLIDDDEYHVTNDRPFDPRWYALSPKAQCVVEQVINDILESESRQFLRIRKRQPVAMAKFELQVEAIVCDLIIRECELNDTWLTINLSDDRLNERTNRYLLDIMGKTIPDTLERMQSLGYLELNKGCRNLFQPALSHQSKIRIGCELRSLMYDHELKFEDFSSRLTSECIVLKAPKKDILDNGDWIQYEETDATEGFRQQMDSINEWIAYADIEFDDGDVHEVNANDRFLRRYFNNASFEQGGRLSGGFWQRLSKKQCREGLAIDGASVVTLDYDQMVPRIMYRLAGEEMISDDAYAIPGLEDYRDGVKKVFNAMLHSSKPLEMKPKGTSELLPKELTINDITSKILQHHEAVSSLFYSGRGMYVTYIESEILVRVLLDLARWGVIALPTHDAVIVKEDDQGITESIMLTVFENMTGTKAVVHVED